MWYNTMTQETYGGKYLFGFIGVRLLNVSSHQNDESKWWRTASQGNHLLNDDRVAGKGKSWRQECMVPATHCFDKYDILCSP